MVGIRTDGKCKRKDKRDGSVSIRDGTDCRIAGNNGEQASDSLVDEKQIRPSGIQSISGHVESGEKTGGPPSKPKYYSVSDSGEVL